VWPHQFASRTPLRGLPAKSRRGAGAALLSAGWRYRIRGLWGLWRGFGRRGRTLQITLIEALQNVHPAAHTDVVTGAELNEEHGG